jgi:hypothetical protein
VGRSFLIFPTGAAGVALLLLRLSVAACLAEMITKPMPPLLCAVTLLLIPGLLSGFCTRIIAATTTCIMIWISVEHGGSLGVFVGLQSIDAVALLILGAGGYSADALLFGRRVLDLDG